MKSSDVSSPIGRSDVLGIKLGDLFLDGELQIAVNGEPIVNAMPHHHDEFKNAFLDLMIWNGFRLPVPDAIAIIFVDWLKSVDPRSYHPDTFNLTAIGRDFTAMSKFIYFNTLVPRELLTNREALDSWMAHHGWNGLDQSEQTIRYLGDEQYHDVVDQSKNRNTDPYWIHLL